MKTKKIEYRNIKHLEMMICHFRHLSINFNDDEKSMREAIQFLSNHQFKKTSDCYWSQIWECDKKTVIINR